MKVLSFQQPWATLVAYGIKDIENRTWQPKEVPSKILIHASKKTSLRMMANEPIEWVQEIFNEQMMGNLPDFSDMPSNAIIGYFSIEAIDKNPTSIWASGTGEEEKLLFWHVNDAYVFDKPILDVKGKLHLWEYDIDENNLPPAHQVELYGYDVKNDEVIIPINEERWNSLGENQSLNFELGIYASVQFCKENVYDLQPFKTIVFRYKDLRRKFELLPETESQYLIDDKNEPQKYLSLFEPDGAQRWIAHFAWGKEIK